MAIVSIFEISLRTMPTSFYARILLAFMAIGMSIAIPATLVAKAAHPAVAQEAFEGSKAWEKLDLRFREAWHDAQTADKGQTLAFECLLKTKGPISENNKVILKAAGFQVRTVIGQIATGNVRVSQVPDVARLSLVEVMELAVPL